MYFLIDSDQDGDATLTSFKTKEALLADLKARAEDDDPFHTEKYMTEGDLYPVGDGDSLTMDVTNMHPHVVIIKGEVVVPKSRVVVKDLDVE